MCGGHISIVSSNRYRWYVVFIDKFTCFTWIYFLKEKSGVKDIFLMFKLQIGFKIKTLQSYRGGEFQYLASLLNGFGISRHFSHPHIVE